MGSKLKILLTDADFAENLWLIQGKLARGLLSSSTSPEVRNKIMEELSLTGVDFVLSEYQVMIVQINDLKVKIKEMPMLNIYEVFQKIRNIIVETFSSKEPLLCFTDENLHLIVLRNFEETGILYEITCVKNIQKKIEKKTGYIVTVSCGDVKKSIKDVPCSYYEANCAMRDSTGRKKEALLKYSPEKQKNGRFPKVLYREERALIQCLWIGDKEKIAEQLEKFFNIAEETAYYLWQLKYACIRLITAVIHNSDDIEGFYERYDEEIPEMLELINKLYLCDSRDCLKQMVRDSFVRAGYVAGEPTETDSSQFLVRMALKYIEKYYSTDIRAKDLAEILGITPNYFSRIFKVYTNENFVGYLNKFRIKKAMILLKQPKLKIYQIAEMAGYSDYKYFSQVFHKYTNYTPKEYRNLPPGENVDL